MLFKSPHANMQFKIRSAIPKRHPLTGDIYETIPSVWANFGQLGGEVEVTDPLTGEKAVFANISGHFFDTDMAALENGWDDDVKEMVERTLLRKCSEVPMFIQLLERTVVAAPAPWIGYDSHEDAEEIIAAAVTLKLVPEVLVYEGEHQGRPEVLEPLQDVFSSLPEEERARAARTVAFKDGDLSTDRSGPDHPMRIGTPPPRNEYGNTQVTGGLTTL